MIILILLTVFAMLILLFGFLEIRIPFLSGKNKLGKEAMIETKVSFNIPIKIDENLIKDSVEETLKKTQFLSEKSKKAYSTYEDHV